MHRSQSHSQAGEECQPDPGEQTKAEIQVPKGRASEVAAKAARASMEERL